MKKIIALLFLSIIIQTSKSQSYINYVIGKYVGSVTTNGCPTPMISLGALYLSQSPQASNCINEIDSSGAGTFGEPWNIFVNTDSTMLRYPGMDSVAHGRLFANDSIYLYVITFGSPACYRIFRGFKLYSTVGIDELNNPENAILISPQPASDDIYIQSTQLLLRKEDEPILYDLSGKKVQVSTFYINSNTYKIDVSNLKQGVYFVSIITDKGLQRKKIIIQ